MGTEFLELLDQEPLSFTCLRRCNGDRHVRSRCRKDQLTTALD
jgi:hypothetical protein